jgi:hypothetical protein
MDESRPEVRVNNDVDPNFLLVSIPALQRAFFAGIDKFLEDVFADPHMAAVAEKRLDNLVLVIPARERNDE